MTNKKEMWEDVVLANPTKEQVMDFLRNYDWEINKAHTVAYKNGLVEVEIRFYPTTIAVAINTRNGINVGAYMLNTIAYNDIVLRGETMAGDKPYFETTNGFMLIVR